MAKKIRVEIELTHEQVRELIEGGKRGPKVVTNAELNRMAEGGHIRAADYLDEAQQERVGLAIPSWIKKAGEKAVTAAVTKTVTEAAAEAADAALVALLAEGVREEDDKPKE